MKRLELRLSHIEDARIKVIPYSFAASDSVIPFNGQSEQLRIVLKALNAEVFSSPDFSAREREWMRQNELLAPGRGGFHSDMRKNIGEVLYETLFPKGSHTEKVFGNSTFDNAGLHIQIEVEGDVGQHSLFDYPWELLHDGKGFLAESGVAISRYIANENSPPNLPPLKRINVLLVSSQASDLENNLPPLSDEEHLAVRSGLENANLKIGEDVKNEEYIHIDELSQPVTFEKLSKYVLEHTGEETPHIIHFDGHGHFGWLCRNILPGIGECKTFNPGLRKKCKNEKCSLPLPHHQGYLLFGKESGEPDYISAQDIAALLGYANRSNTTNHGITLVVLSACKSSLSLAENSVFNGVAQRLIKQGIPAVVGMAFSVRADSATAFTEQFYRAIRKKLPLVQAMDWGRLAMSFGSNQWYRPVLYMRWKDNEGDQMFAAQTEYNRGVQVTGKQQIEKQTALNGENSSKLQEVLQNPTKADKMQKSADDLLALAISYYEEVKAKQKQVLPVFLLFDVFHTQDLLPEYLDEFMQSPLFDVEDIWPEHCELAIQPLQEIAKPVQKLYDLLDGVTTRQHTVEMIQLCYELLTPLGRGSELLMNLISLISKFRDVCRTSSSDMMDQRREIQSKLKSLGERLVEVNRYMDLFS